CLRARLTASEDPDCPDFGRLIEESIRRTALVTAPICRPMTHCPHCTTAYEELAALRDAPRTALAEGLLPWGGTGYAAGGPVERAAGDTGVWWAGSGPAGPGRESEDGERAPDHRRTVLVSAVLGAACW
ncbi:ricin-type beta-trefoil lectin domain protein, partial [Streptomyces thermocarboxydus]